MSTKISSQLVDVLRAELEASRAMLDMRIQAWEKAKQMELEHRLKHENLLKVKEQIKRERDAKADEITDMEKELKSLRDRIGREMDANRAADERIGFLEQALEKVTADEPAKLAEPQHCPETNKTLVLAESIQGEVGRVTVRGLVGQDTAARGHLQIENTTRGFVPVAFSGWKHVRPDEPCSGSDHVLGKTEFSLDRPVDLEADTGAEVRLEV